LICWRILPCTLLPLLLLLSRPARENVQRLAKDGYLFVTFANHHYTDFAMSFVARLRALNMSNYLVGAMDDDILSTLARRGVPTFHMRSGEQQGLDVLGWAWG
jgi:hypothetical protein